MANANVITRANTILGEFNITRSLIADGWVTKDPAMGAAKIGALTTRTSDSVGTLTMAVGHGIIDADRLDLYWLDPDGVTRRYRYGCTVGVVAVNEVPITAGAGDVLPVDEHAITAMVPNLESFPVLTAAMKMLAVGCEAPMIAVFMSVVPAVVLAVTADGNQDSYVWDINGGMANPFGADTVDVYLSHGASNATYAPKAAALVT